MCNCLQCVHNVIISVKVTPDSPLSHDSPLLFGSVKKQKLAGDMTCRGKVDWIFVLW